MTITQRMEIIRQLNLIAQQLYYLQGEKSQIGAAMDKIREIVGGST